MKIEDLTTAWAILRDEHDRRIRQFLDVHNITIEQAPELCIIDRFYDGSWNIRLQTDGDRMLLKLKQAQRAPAMLYA